MHRRRLILTDAIVVSCLSAVAIYTKRSRFVSNSLQTVPCQLTLFYPPPRRNHMILRLMVTRIGSKQRNLDDIQELRTVFVLVPVLRKTNLCGFTGANGSDPSAICILENLPTSDASTVWRLVGIC